MGKKILITGASGQLGYELQRSVPTNYQLICTDVDRLDICQSEQVEQFVAEYQPDVIINAAAYTAVDKAESEDKLAWKINEQGAKNLAITASEHQAQIIQISTDFVFDGKQSSPYLEEDYTGESSSVYGKSKHAGEKAVVSFAPNNSLIIRTAWLYSAHGNNFVKSMLKLMQERDSLGIVVDQIGTPTWANTLAQVIWKLEAKQQSGFFHCSDNGVASWYDFAVVVQQQALQKGLLNTQIPIKAIRTQDYPTPAQRPAYSVMDKRKTEQAIGETLPHWQKSLDKMLDELMVEKN